MLWVVVCAGNALGGCAGDNNTTTEACINLAASEGLVYGIYGWLAATLFPVGFACGLLIAGGGR
jgi:hypothetical protein